MSTFFFSLVEFYAAGLGKSRSTLIKIKGICSNLFVTKCCNVVLMVDEIAMACTIAECEHVSIINRGAFPSPVTLRSVQGINLTAGHNNIHCSMSGKRSGVSRAAFMNRERFMFKYSEFDLIRNLFSFAFAQTLVCSEQRIWN